MSTHGYFERTLRVRADVAAEYLQYLHANDVVVKAATTGADAADSGDTWRITVIFNAITARMFEHRFRVRLVKQKVGEK